MMSFRAQEHTLSQLFSVWIKAVDKVTLLNAKVKCTGGQHIHFYFSQVITLVWLLPSAHSLQYTDTLYRVSCDSTASLFVQTGPVSNFPSKQNKTKNNKKTNSIPVRGKYMKLQQTDT